jgi:hypothetical protein
MLVKDQQRSILGKLAVSALALGLVGQAWAEGPPAPGLLAKAEAGASLKGRTVGTASPGSTIRLCLEQPVKSGSRYHWVQTDGPPVSLEGQAGPELKLTVPLGAESLGFLLVVSDEQGIKTANFVIPIVGRATEISTGPRADAGDDTIGLVGRRITLNGSESRPSEGLSYRWIQMDGPQLVGLDEAGRFCSFVPAAPGQYRFALVVAHENRISPADFVVVSVGTPPAPTAGPVPIPLTGMGGQAVAPAMMPSLPAQAPSTSLDAAVAQALATLDDASMVAGPLAEVFQAASLRMDLYRTYGEIFSEISRRLDAVVPADPIRRGRWNALLFEPLTAQTVASLVPLGLDLRVPGSQDAPLTNPQRQELRGLFERLARRLAAPRVVR